MHGFQILLLVAVAIFAAWFFYYRYYQPWKKLERILESLTQNLTPTSYSIGGAAPFQNISHTLEKLAQRQQKLTHQIHEEGFNLQAILSSMMEGVMVVDQQHIIRQVNAEFLHFFHLEKSPLQRSVLEVLREAPIEMILRDAIRTGKPQNREIALTLISEETHAPRQVEISAVPIKNEAGRTRGVVAVFYDISRLKQLEQIRREFVANVSHELRTPLSIFHGYVETLLESPPESPAEQQRILNILKRHSQRLNLLVDDLLTIARLESRRIHFEPVAIRLRPFLSQIIEDWNHKLKEKQLQIELQADPSLPPLEADPTRLEQVFSNLLDNAVKYSNRNTAICICVSQEDQTMEINVRDHGLGIPAADLPHVFERFYRVDKARSRDLGGTGLGLSIVKHIVQLHGGTVSAQSEVEQGTTITLRLPLHQSPHPNENVADDWLL